MDIAKNILLLKRSLPAHVRIVAVSKMQPVSALLEAYHAGQRMFGENKVQELIAKQSQLPSDVEWHFIGHLQRNKVRYLASFIAMIHSIDSLKLLHEVNMEAGKLNRVIDCLLQFHIASEETKFGMDMLEANLLLESKACLSMKNIKIAGVMGMSSFSDDADLVRSEFRNLYEIFQRLKLLHFQGQDTFQIVSMGMSGDYLLAIEEGSNMVRIGTAIFGDPNN